VWIEVLRLLSEVFKIVDSIVIVVGFEKEILSTFMIFSSAFSLPFEFLLFIIVAIGSVMSVLSFLLSFYWKKDSLLLLFCLLKKLDNIFQDCLI